MGSWGKTDFDALRGLSRQLERLERADMDRFCREAAQELAARILRRVSKLMPVGVKPKLEGKKTAKVKGASGKSRSFLTAEGARLEQYWSGYVGGNLRRGWTVGAVQKVGDAYEIEVINTADYASYVEYGHRQTPGRYVPALGKRLKTGWVKGRFMLTISEQELRAKAPGLLEEKLARYLKEALNAQ